MLAIAAACFLAGLAVHPAARETIAGKLSYTKNPHLDVAVRVRVLNGLLQERYPEASGERISRHDNWDALDRLASCLETNTCTGSERKVLLLSSYHFGRSEAGANGGEEVWARSMISAFHHLNYTILYAWGSMDTLFIYQSIPEMVTAVLWEQAEWGRCIRRNESNYLEMDKEEKQPSPWQTGTHACIQSENFPHGIPHWKSFQFFFWADTTVPLGGKWMLSPEDYDAFRGDKPGHTYLGYSIEKRCDMYPTFTDREHRALILAKHAEYFEEKHNYFHGLLGPARDAVRPTRNDKGEEVPFVFISTADNAGDKIDAAGVETVGMKAQREWTEILARSKALLGIGHPMLSPSPYYALCMGVPFINPIYSWDTEHPDDRSKWATQQDALRFTEEPYVYHVRGHDQDGLRDALQRAADTPIPRYIPPHMRFEAVVERVRKFVETDWHAEARAYVADHYKNATEWQYLAMDEPAEPLHLRGKNV
ncbi:hypothetical protein CC85DRAFT_257531 [Cutaneotrichosporon oleaginosum]|uniref:Glycosyltransferase family 18 catalytic domain-containing protein n=1 Tax=Cutaneotrichosporon oleaginosum TaxID=879819 RepID=A0A0J0XSQ9_9TREE|nr:uncharacterized protein CC85DRAFT_257531 [Cutaneotrichosporon oleaginosum]KLT44090.1 hypothetical protein CC85DRAFT_257531 [Cutaneotrichosporon oleaginosum]TXT09455.1 hypothetical protein COLE_03389 [Cutaneotrichosporon oleaginosum]